MNLFDAFCIELKVLKSKIKYKPELNNSEKIAFRIARIGITELFTNKISKKLYDFPKNSL